MNATWVNRLPLCHFAETATYILYTYTRTYCMYEYSIQYNNKQQQQQLGKDQNIVQYIWFVLYDVVHYSTSSMHGTLEPQGFDSKESLNFLECYIKKIGNLRVLSEQNASVLSTQTFSAGPLCSAYRANSVRRLQFVHCTCKCYCNWFAFY